MKSKRAILASPQLRKCSPSSCLTVGEPALDDGVVVAVAPSAHAPGHAMRLKETLVVFAGIRTALIGVMQEPAAGCDVSVPSATP